MRYRLVPNCDYFTRQGVVETRFKTVVITNNHLMLELKIGA